MSRPRRSQASPKTKPIRPATVFVFSGIVLALIGPVLIAVGRLLPLLVSHEGETAMVDGPGVLDHGVCCVEPTWHFLARTAAVLGPVAVVFGLVLAAVSAVLASDG